MPDPPDTAPDVGVDAAGLRSRVEELLDALPQLQTFAVAEYLFEEDGADFSEDVFDLLRSVVKAHRPDVVVRRCSWLE